jgi:hypothetical protein
MQYIPVLDCWTIQGEARSRTKGGAGLSAVCALAMAMVLSLSACVTKRSPDLVTAITHSATALRSCHFTMVGTLAFRLAGSSAIQQQLVNFQATGTASGPRVMHMQLLVTPSPSSQRAAIDIVEMGRMVYLSSAKQWQSAPVDEAHALYLLNPLLYLKVLQAVTSATPLNQIEVDHHRTQHLALHLNSQRAARLLQQNAPYFTGFADHAHLHLQAWLDVTTQQLRRLRIVLRTRTLAFLYRATVTFSHINAPVAILAPVAVAHGKKRQR